jgi:hypothetical protein
MATDQEMIDAVRHTFAAEPRPKHFTDHTHCCECAQHDAVLASRDVDSLRVEDINNAGWDPICFVTAAGFRYYLPALVRLALVSATAEDWYLPQLLVHLIGDGPQTRRVMCCTAGQRRAIVAVLWHVDETRPALIVRYRIEDDLHRALEIWSTPALESPHASKPVTPDLSASLRSVGGLGEAPCSRRGDGRPWRLAEPARETLIAGRGNPLKEAQRRQHWQEGH